MAKTLVFVALGGALGAMGRYLVVGLVGRWAGAEFPFGTLAVNVLGSFVLGALVATMALRWEVPPEARAFLVVGVLGAFTTFSAFSLDVIQQWERGQAAEAAIYVVASVTLSVLGLLAGLRLVRFVLP